MGLATNGYQLLHIPDSLSQLQLRHLSARSGALMEQGLPSLSDGSIARGVTIRLLTLLIGG